MSEVVTISVRRDLRWRVALAGALTAMIAPLATAQISNDAPPAQRTLPVAEQVEEEMATARLRLGPMRLLPFFSLGNVGWTNNARGTSEGQVDDYTASVSAGTKLVAPFGQKVFLRGTVAPSYDWYSRTESLRSFGGVYSGELLGLFNRVTLGGGGGYDRSIRSVSSEVARDVLNTTTSGSARAEVEVLKRLSLFGGLESATFRQEDTTAPTPGLDPVSNLDRTESAWRAGVRYVFSSTLSLGLMGEEVKSQFVTNPEVQDNNVRGVVLVARYDRKRFYVEGAVGIREGKAVNPNDFYPEFQTGTYGYFVSYVLFRPLELQVRGSRRPTASLFLDNPYFFETLNEIGFRYGLGRRVTLHVEGSIGSNRYVNPVVVTATGDIVTRVDDISRWGGGFDFAISRSVKVGLTAMQDRWDSNIDYYDRSAFRIFGGLTVAATYSAEERR